MSEDITPIEYKAPIINRLTVVQRVYHQIDGGDAKDYPFHWHRLLVSDEQAWGPKKKQATTEPTRLDLGWLNNQPLSLLIFKNTETEKGKVLKIGFGEMWDCLRVYPGEILTITPSFPDQIVVSSESVVGFTVTAMPE